MGQVEVAANLKNVFFKIMGWKQLLNQWICRNESDSVILLMTNIWIFSWFFQPCCIVTADKFSDPACHVDKPKSKNTNKKKVNVNLQLEF